MCVYCVFIVVFMIETIEAEIVELKLQIQRKQQLKQQNLIDKIYLNEIK